MARKTRNNTKKQRSGDHSAAFVAGSLLGGLTGALLALWNTPQSGPALRQRFAGPLGLRPQEPELPLITTPITNEPIPQPDPVVTTSPPASTGTGV